MNLLIVTSYYLLILISIIGYGLIFNRLFKLNLSLKEFSLIGIIGLIFITFISFVTNIVVAHNFEHNILFLSIGITYFFLFDNYFFLKKIRKNKKKLIQLFLIITFFSIINSMGKTHDDFGWYHLPYTLNLSQNKLQIGLGHFNHGFRTHSSLFYTNSLFYLPIIKNYSYNFAQSYLFFFTAFYFYQKLFDGRLNKLLNIFSILSFGFILIFFYRLAEHGTDRSGQILILLLTFMVLKFMLDSKEKFYSEYRIFLIILTYIVTLKSYFIIFGILLIPLIFINKKDIIFFKKTFDIKLISFLTLFIIFNYGIQFLNSGCILYPISFTCYENFIWSFKLQHVKDMNVWYELWSKGGANPNWRTEEDFLVYINNFNWVSNWFENYFFNKFSDFLLGLFLFVLIIFLFIKKEISHSNLKKKINLLYLLFLFLILLALWFEKFPQLRYGGFIIVANIIFLSFCFFISNLNFNNKIYKSMRILSIIIIIIFSIRNIDRLKNEYKLYDYNIISNAFYNIESKKFYTEILNDNIKINISDGSCWITPQPCTHRNIKAKKINSYIVYYE